jgi:hypothetical protein
MLQCPICSRLFIFYNSKKFVDPLTRGREPVNFNDGTSIRSSFKSVELYGACAEELFPYAERTTHYTPNAGAVLLT